MTEVIILAALCFYYLATVATSLRLMVKERFNYDGSISLMDLILVIFFAPVGLPAYLFVVGIVGLTDKLGEIKIFPPSRRRPHIWDD